MSKLGCSLKLAVFLVLVVLGLVVVGFLSGPIGSNFIGKSLFPSITVEQPHPELPAEKITHLGPVPVTNSMISTWLAMAVILAIALSARAKLQLIPRGVQNIFEFIVEKLLGFCESVAGKEWGRKFFPVVATIFIFVIVNAYISLLPGYGSIYIMEEGKKVHLLRGSGTDLNTPLAIAIISFIFVEFMGIRALGFFKYMGKFFRFKKILHGQVSGLIDVFVGVLEMLSEFIRIVSFTFRLFGNMTAGEILLLVIVFLLPWGIAPLFYGLELLVGFVQALIFSGLTLVFVTMAVASHDEGH